MFRLNFKIALRSLLRYRTISIINIGGLALGLSSCILLLLYIAYERRYDKQFSDSGRLYQVMINLYDSDGGVLRTIDKTQNVVAAKLESDFPEVEESVRITSLYARLVRVDNNSLKLQSRYADASIFSIFDYTFLSGNAHTALAGPNSVVLTETAAIQLFGTRDVLDRALEFEDQVSLKVTGVIKDLPANMTYNFQMLTPWKLFENLNEWPKIPSWGNHDYNTLIKVKSNSDIASLNNNLKGLIKRNFPLSKEDLFLYPLSDLHLHGSFVNGQPSGGRIQQIQLLIGLSLGILLIACINFINLSTANAQKRTKEIGIKKTIGASRASLMFQFILESLMLTSVSVLVSIIIVEFSLPWFNSLLGIQLSIDYFDPLTWMFLLSILVITGAIAGCYPAVYLSGLKTVESLKTTFSVKRGFNLSFRQLLVIGQFTFAFMLIMGTVTIYKQIQYLKNKPLGYESSGLIEIPHEGMLYLKYELLKSKLIASGAVINMCQSSHGITNKGSTIRGLEWEGMPAAGKNIDFDQIYTLNEFLATMDIKLVSGRDFSKKFASDTAGLLLSKTAVQVMNLKKPVGARILYQGEMRTVIGVFEDIIWGNPGVSRAPMLIAFGDHSDVITMRLNPRQSISGSIAVIESVLKEINPNFPVQINFISSLNALKLKDEAQLGALGNVFSYLTIFISCMGLFALSAFSAEQRRKEVSIRKVLGASVAQLMALLSSSFIKLVLISILIAIPISLILVNRWLDHFDVRTPLSIWMFLLSAAITIFIAIVTVSWQTYRVAVSNPISALKYE